MGTLALAAECRRRGAPSASQRCAAARERSILALLSNSAEQSGHQRYSWLQERPPTLAWREFGCARLLTYASTLRCSARQSLAKRQIWRAGSPKRLSMYTGRLDLSACENARDLLGEILRGALLAASLDGLAGQQLLHRQIQFARADAHAFGNLLDAFALVGFHVVE
jgi:hypothetical protein